MKLSKLAVAAVTPPPELLSNTREPRNLPQSWVKNSPREGWRRSRRGAWIILNYEETFKKGLERDSLYFPRPRPLRTRRHHSIKVKAMTTANPTAVAIPSGFTEEDLLV